MTPPIAGPSGAVSTRRYAGAIALVIVAGLIQYLGAALAVGLFGQVPAVTTGWWRVVLAAVLLLAWRRPWRGGYAWWGRAALFGVILAGMNLSFYAAIDHLPLATVVSIEFLGPVGVVAVAGRGWHQRAAIVLAAAGVAIISGFGLDWAQPGTGPGLFFTLLAGACWAGYIVLGRRQSLRVNGLDALSVGMAAGALAFAPLAAGTASAALTSWAVFGTLLGVAVLSSVVPYAIDQLNFGALPASTFAILTALMPATSLVVGAVMLRQVPNGAELSGLGLVSVALLLANRPGG